MLNQSTKSCAIILGFAISTGAGIGHAGPGKSPQSDDSPFISSKSHATNPKVYGKTYGEWGAEWWKWALSFPEDMNPVRDDTGDLCDLGQSGPVWFLAGTFGATGVERDCTIPAGKAIFYPLVNTTWLDTSDDDAQIPDNEIRLLISDIGDNWCQMSSTLDTLDTESSGEVPAPVTALGRLIGRAQSPEDSVYLPDGNIFGVPSGVYERLIAEGYWVMLPPLTRGEHVLTLQGAGCSENGDGTLVKTFETEVTYFLNVGP